MPTTARRRRRLPRRAAPRTRRLHLRLPRRAAPHDMPCLPACCLPQHLRPTYRARKEGGAHRRAAARTEKKSRRARACWKEEVSPPAFSCAPARRALRTPSGRARLLYRFCSRYIFSRLLKKKARVCYTFRHRLIV